MTYRPFTAAVTALMAFSLTAPGASFSVAAQNRDGFDPNKPIDGAVSAAACRPYGFTLPTSRDGDGRVVTRLSPPPPPAPMPPPSPVQRTPQSSPSPVADIIITGSSGGAFESTSTSGASTLDSYIGISPPASRPADTERYPDATPNPVKSVADEPVSTFSIDVDTAAYANVRRFVDEGRRPPVDAVRIEELVNYFDYGYARPRSASEPFAITTAVVASPWSPGRQIVHIGLQGYELPETERRPLNLTFMVDVSGSMHSPDKLALAQKSMNLIIDRLRPQDRVAVTFYASDVGTAVGPTPGDQKLKLRCAVAALNAGGSTAGAQGMVNAYSQAEAAFGRDKVNRILMFTDGDFNVGQTDNQRLEDYVATKRETGIYLSVYGFGRGNYQDERMQAISQAGNGTAAYVDDLNEARRLFGPAFDKGAFPIADDVKIQVEFNPARVSEYRLIGYETRLLNEEDFNNDRIDAGEVGSGASVTALYEITPVGGPSQIPERRYEANRSIGIGGGDPDGEVGFVQVRFKPPGGDTSRLIQRVLSNSGNGAGSAPESTRWALAVAAFGQKLRDDPWMDAGYDWDAVLAQAQGARGEDPYGERAEFVQMVRAAQGLPAQARP